MWELENIYQISKIQITVDANSNSDLVAVRLAVINSSFGPQSPP